MRKSPGKKLLCLLCIDMQYLDAARGHGVFATAETANMPPEAQDYYFDRLDNMVLPNVARLQKSFRDRELEVIHTRIQSLTMDGRERSPGHKRLGLHALRGLVNIGAMLMFFSATWGLVQEGMLRTGAIQAVDGFDFLEYADTTFTAMREALSVDSLIV